MEHGWKQAAASKKGFALPPRGAGHFPAQVLHGCPWVPVLSCRRDNSGVFFVLAVHCDPAHLQRNNFWRFTLIFYFFLKFCALILGRNKVFLFPLSFFFFLWRVCFFLARSSSDSPRYPVMKIKLYLLSARHINTLCLANIVFCQICQQVNFNFYGGLIAEIKQLLRNNFFHSSLLPERVATHS